MLFAFLKFVAFIEWILLCEKMRRKNEDSRSHCSFSISIFINIFVGFWLRMLEYTVYTWIGRIFMYYAKQNNSYLHLNTLCILLQNELSSN